MTALTGTAALARLILRRDRFLLALWIVVLALVPVSYISPLADLYPTAASRQQYAGNVGFITLYGQLSGTSLGEFISWRAGFLPVMVGLAGLLTVIRHTRVEEETGRRELLGSTVVGRQAPLAAALLTTIGAQLVLAVLLALGMSSQGLPRGGSIALGLEFAVVGAVFAAVGAVAAQLTPSAATARGMAVSVLGAAFALRAAGDASGHSGGGLAWLSWLSPIGWGQRIRPYGDERWWLVPITAGSAALLVVVAAALSARRDVGGGLFPDRLGPAAAAPGLRSPLALAWRLQRGLLAGWLAGFALLGVLFGGVAEGVGDMLRDEPNLQEAFARLGGRAGLVDTYLAAVMSIVGLIAAAYAVQATARLRLEETSGRAETVLATAVPRLRWAASHLVFAVLGPAAALLTAGATMGVTYGLASGNVGHELPRMLTAALAQLPAVWILAAIAIALFGLLPRLTAAAWAALAICLLISLVGTAMRLDRWVLDVSPFTHLPRLPGGPTTVTPLVTLTAIAVLLTGAGLAALRRRDVPA